MATSKTEGGKSIPASAYAYIGQKDMPSTYKLRIDDARHTAAAVAALEKGFMGNKVQIPTKDLPAVKRKVAAAYRKFFPDNEVPNVLKSLDIQVEGKPIDGGLLGTVVEAMAQFFRMKEYKDQLLEDNSDFVEEAMGCEDCCPACGCDMSNVEGTVCPQCGCDVSKIPGYDGDGNDSEDNADQMSEEPDDNGNMVVKSLNEEQQKALFVVLSPDEVDLHGDTYSTEEVEKACESFNTHCRKANLFHASPTSDPVITQSFIAMDNFKTDSGIDIKKGMWLQWWSFPKENETACKLWKSVKSGEINGVSVGCKATVEEL